MVARELWRESATTLAHLIRSGQTSSREVIEAHLERIEAVNGEVNAVVEVRPEAVRAQADAADAEQRAGSPLGPLHGVPFSVKSNLDVTGYATNEGALALKDFMATSDAPIVEKMRGAGAVVLARTNMPDLGLRINTESSLFGATHNPWKRGYTVGGSSGGEAAALATGMSPIGLGNDIGGSLRNPAYCCGVASIKPSRGRIAQGNPSDVFEMTVNAQIMLAQGVLARHVGDVRRGLEVVMGAHHGDPQSVDVPFDGPPASRRVAMVAEPFGGETDPGVAEGVRVAGRALAEAGYEVDEVEPPMLFEAYVTWTELMMTSLKVARPKFEPFMGEEGRRFLDKYARHAYEALAGTDGLCVLTEWNEFREPDFGRMKALMRSRSSSTAATSTIRRRSGRWDSPTRQSAARERRPRDRRGRLRRQPRSLRPGRGRP